ncbi:MAG: DeoR/GlpR family DNA-binding transcription regulator [Treponema sp.]|jgi:DeoR/GlpR family transcriptional regulator of sugar metabolism|nr:DeoR/GlpR family DNA-binding transcription regulator [Treponema sp.]
MKNRYERILSLLTNDKKVEVSKLSDLFGVSKVTIRKDLDTLESRGLIKREHGAAVLCSQDDINYRLAFHYDQKRIIARAAAGTVKNGETVMIESGSCCALLADEIVHHKRDVTIVTNSAFIAHYVRDCPGGRIVLLGGDYQPDSQVVVGPLATANVKSYFVNKLFIGTDGFRPAFGFAADNMLRAEVVKVMAGQADTVNILTESAKFNQQGIVPLLPYESVSAVYTDVQIPAEAENILQSHNVLVVKGDTGLKEKT